MGTITIPNPLPTPLEDCEKLRKAVQGWGTDERALIRILGHRNANQRSIISQTYKEKYNEDLTARLHSELSGDFRRAMIQWTLNPAERDARLANEVLKKKNSKQLEVLVEIACATSPDHLILVRKAYCRLYERSLEEDIILYVRPPMRKLLVSLVSSYRYNGEAMNQELASEEAKTLREAIERKELEGDDVTWILSTRNMFQLKTTFNYYRTIYGNPVDKDINGVDDNLASLLQTVICCIENPEKHFAKVIRSAIVGLGTDEESLTRAIVARAELDMENIKQEYIKAYNKSLLEDVIGDTSGYYMDVLLTLLGEGQL